MEQLKIIKNKHLENIEYVKSKLEMKINKNGTYQILNTLDNHMTILRNDNRFKDIIVFNEHTQRIEVKKMYKNDKLHSLCDNDLNHIFLDIEKDYKLSNIKNVERAIPLISEENPYNPVLQYFESLKWDGKDRITTMFHDTLGAANNAYNADVAKLLLLGIVARNYKHGCKFDYCVILSSQNTQGLGKSSLCRKLAINDSWFTDSLTSLDGNKDTLQLLRGKTVIELGELKSMNRSKGGIEAVKQFLTAQSDTYRDPFTKYPKDFERTNVFIGTTNKGEYLMDDTGNRRFLPVICASNNEPHTLERIKYHMYEDTQEIKDYIDQLYAQAVHIYKSGKYKLVLDIKHTTELEKLHKQARIYNPNVDLIQNYINTTPYDYIGINSIYTDVFNNGNVAVAPKNFRNEIKSILNSNDVTGVRKVNKVVNTPHQFKERGWEIERHQIGQKFESLPKELEQEFKQVGFFK